jgi:uncharacterized protein
MYDVVSGRTLRVTVPCPPSLSLSTDQRGSEMIHETADMKLRDGVRLAAHVFRPDDSNSKHPVLLMRTPYGRPDGRLKEPPPEADYFAAHGYIVVVQDTRGRGQSEGEYFPWRDEAADGFDAVDWAGQLPGATGEVGMTGQSYLGSTQYLVAPTRPPRLKAMSPISGAVSFFHERVYRKGVLELGWALTYALAMSRATLVRQGRYADTRDLIDSWLEDAKVYGSALSDEAYRMLPVIDWGERLAELGAPYFREFLEHRVDGPFWQDMEVPRQASQIETPMLHVGGWYDAFQYDTIKMFSALHAQQSTRPHQRLLMGPWGHLEPFTTPTSTGTGDIDFGDDARIELLDLQLRWFDHFLKGNDTGLLDEPPVRIFVMGTNRWRDEDAWPLARAEARPLYLHGDGAANTLLGDGRLSFEMPSDEPHDSFVYDPADPVPTTGGQIALGRLGVRDQRSVEQRPDVLVYSGEPQQAPLEITGGIEAVVYLATSAPDTDVTVKLVDVWPNGFAQNLVDGITRASYRESITDPTPIEPGVVYRLSVDLTSISHVVLAGHTLRVEISSSNFPRFDRHTNTARHPLTETNPQIARQQVFHDSRYPTHVVLPVIP